MDTNKLQENIFKNWKALAAACGAILLLALVVGVWKSREAERDRAASNLLYEIQAQSKSLIASKKYAEAEKMFDPLFEKYSGTRAAFEAQLQMGDLWMDAESYPEAVKRYEKAADIAKDPFSKVLVRYNLGIAKESAGQFQEAVVSYEDALSTKGSEFLRPEILMAEARCYEALNQVAKAVGIYKTVQEKYAAKTYYSGAASAFEKQLTP